MSDVVIRADGLGKRYRLGTRPSGPSEVARRLGRGIARRDRGIKAPARAGSRYPEHWALRDASFEVRRGEVVGLIGRNGAGKSTLLKILTRITEPTTGRAEIRGRVGSLLEVGTGFHPELTGRENIYLNGAILGMRRADITRHFDAIVDFAEVERFLDTPVKRYSSGMYVRLAFAVAAHLEPEILLVDEVLAVGDAHFQAKCLAKMDDVAQHGRTILFVSHNMAAVESLCPTAILLKDGSIAQQGPTRDAIAAHFAHIDGVNRAVDELWELDRPGGHTPMFVAGWINGRPILYAHAVMPRSDVVVELELDVPHRMHSCWIDVMLGNAKAGNLIGTSSRWTLGPVDLAKGSHRATCDLSRLPLVPGRYYISIGLVADRGQLDHLERVATLEVMPTDIYGTGQSPNANQGYFVTDARWSVEEVA